MIKPVNYLTLIMILSAFGCSHGPEVFNAAFPSNNHETKWALAELSPGLPPDWSSSGFLTFELKSSSTQWFDLKIYDTSGIRRVSIHPMEGAWVRVSVPLIHFQKRNTKGHDLAAIGKTGRPGYWIGFTGAVGSIGAVDSIGFQMRMPIDSPYIELRNFMLSETAMDTVFGPHPLVDEFGQWILARWPGKAASINDLKRDWAKEDSLLSLPGPEASKFGGFKDLKTRASGFFRVEKIDGRWWLIDPEGYLFFSQGITCVGARAEFARSKGREYIFTPVANKTEDGRIKDYSYYPSNLFYRFGADWYERWIDMTIRRMDYWGINTIANWSDPALGAEGRKPYVVTMSGWGIDKGIMGMPDVYDPGFKSMVENSARQQCESRRNDPWLLGYFVYNEPAWPHRELELAREILSGEDTPMKIELQKYLATEDSPEKRKEFVYKSYEIFINTINSAIRKYDPNHLNLGMRFGGSAPDEIIKASRGFDVFSFNSYGYSVNGNIIKRVSEMNDQPMIIGEFHFGVPEKGLAPGLAQVRNQAERAVAYRYYVENAASYSSIIGAHWFQWLDQPSTGRYDGENYNIGFIDITDRPYNEMVIASRETFNRLFSIHSGTEAPTGREAVRK